MGDLAQLRKTTGAALCLECGKCSTMCPLAPFGGFSAARMMSMHDPDTEIHGHAEAVERCLTCASCEVRCPQGVRYTEFVLGLRQELPAQSRRPRPHGEVFQMAARVSGETGHGRPVVWLREGLRVAEEGDVALFVGCLPIFDVVFGDEFQVEMVEIARAAVRLLNRLGIEPVVLGEECCCGHDLLWSGDQEDFEILARKNVEVFQSHGIKHILTVCAECCRTWRVDYPEVVDGYRPRVEHLSEFLAPRLETEGLSFQPSANGAVTYQDPCRLGRQLGVLDQPRQLLQAVPGADLVEMEFSGSDALCCGTAGFVHCDSVSRELQAQRLRSAAATGASKLVTACPKCLLHFRCAQTEDQRMNHGSETEIEVEDLTVYLANLVADPSDSENTQEAETSQTGERR